MLLFDTPQKEREYRKLPRAEMPWVQFIDL